MSETATPDTDADAEYVDHKYIAEGAVEAREYQTHLADAAGAESSLVALPTGTGKTVVSLLITAHRLAEHRGRSVFLAPTKPLVEQQAEFYKEALDIPESEIEVFTGDVRPDKREELWEQAKSVIFATPQVMENDLLADRISMEDVTHLTFDECHRATGDYAYVYVAEKYHRQAENPLVTGMSASPGSNEEEILTVCKNLGVTNIEVITEDDPRMEPYVHDVEVNEVYIDIHDEILEVRDLLQERKKECLQFLKDNGYIDSARKNLPSYKLRQAPPKIKQDMGPQTDDSTPYTAMSMYAEAMKLSTAIEMVETQGIDAFQGYMERLEDEATGEDSSKAVKRLLEAEKVREARQVADDYDRTHPKLQHLRGYLPDLDMGDKRMMVFTENRDNVSALVEFLNSHEGLTAHRFIGQSGDEGLSQKEQNEVLEKFREGEYDILVATSIGEEGLDIPQVDIVVFYEPTASGIRTIQRRGRTGRAHEGEVAVFIGKKTRDYGYHMKAQQNEEQMEEDITELRDMQDDLSERLREILGEEDEEDGQASLDAFGDEGDGDEDAENDAATSDGDDGVTVTVDSRETSSNVVKELDRTEGVTPEIENNMEVADYVVSDRTAVERKSVEDFHATLTGGDRSMFEQVGEIANNYDRPIVIIEGSDPDMDTKEELFQANIHPNAIRGSLSSLIVDFGASIVYATDEEDTAQELIALAKREQQEKDREVHAHGNKSTETTTDQQEYIVSAIADIGPKLAKRLLDEFGSVKAVINASRDELQAVEGVGEKTADRIYSIIREEYEP